MAVNELTKVPIVVTRKEAILTTTTTTAKGLTKNIMQNYYQIYRVLQ